MDLPAASGDRNLGIGLLLASFVLLSYEVVQLRIFAFSVNPMLVYSAIGITMLGFGIASTALSLSERLRRMALGPALAAVSVALALSGILANEVFARASAGIQLRPGLAGTFTASTVGVILLGTLPYAFGGMLVALVLSGRARHAGSFYAINLLGSALGCFAVNFLLGPLGAERMVFVLMGLAALCGGLFAGAAAPRLRVAALAVALGLLAASPFAPRLLAFSPDSGDQHATMASWYGRMKAGDPVREYAAWDPVARVEIHSWPGQMMKAPAPMPFKILTQDGGAASLLLAVDRDPERGARVFGDTLFGVALQLRPESDVLVIGMGGAPDVQAALGHRAKHVTAVEINGATIRAVREDFARFLGRPLEQPGVETVLADGRSFVRGTHRRYDVIQMSGVDTVTVQSSGSFVLAEDYLYTVDAFEDYMRALNPAGVLSLLRFAHEPYRLSAIAVAALRRLGADHPERHVVVLGQSSMKSTLVKRSPWTDEELAEIDRIVERSADSNRGIALFAYDIFDLRLGEPLVYVYAPHRSGDDPVFSALFRAVREGRDPGVVVPTDDSPYYFSAEWVDYFRGREVGGVAAEQLGMYVRFMAILVGLALLAILVPPAVFRARGLRAPGSVAALGYFFALGFCYMFLEIGLIQKAIIVVEHPSYSVSVVLAALLASSSLGSLASGRSRLPDRTIVLIAACGIAVFGGVWAIGLGGVFREILPLPLALRMAVLALLVAPLGTAMGMLFPTGLRRLGLGAERLVPWAIAVNGFASVIGSVVSLPFAVLFGFTRLLAVGVAVYLLGCAAFLRLPAASPRAPDPPA